MKHTMDRSTGFSVAALCALMWLIPNVALGQGTGLILPTESEILSVPPAHTPFSGTELPKSADLSNELPPPGNQGNQNSCVGWALAYAMKSYQEHIEEGTQLVHHNGHPNFDHVFSPAFIYNQINQGRDGGCNIHEALNLMQDQGACAWSDMPYDTQDYLRKPSAQAVDRAKRYRINVYRRVNAQSPRELKTQIQAGYPIVIGANIDGQFKRFDNPPGWIWRQTEGGPGGAHAMLVVGYDDHRSAFKVINSWGRDWGDDGYCWIDYSHFGRVVPLAYVAMDAKNGPGPVVINDPNPPVDPDPPVVDPNPFDKDIRFWVTNIEYSASYPDRPDLGNFMKIDGGLRIPGRVGRNNQVVIHFFYTLQDGQVGSPVPSLVQEYSDFNGNTACGTALYPIPAEGLETTYSSWISHAAFNVPAGQWYQSPQGPQYQPYRTYMYAIPTLFVDNFGVARGDPISFYMDK